jgi:hypothetical protein
MCQIFEEGFTYPKKWYILLYISPLSNIKDTISHFYLILPQLLKFSDDLKKRNTLVIYMFVF